MRVVLCLLLFFVSTFARSFKHPKFEKATHAAVFRRWRKHFGKNYDSKKLETQKFVTFLQNYKFVSSINSQNLTYKLGLNEFADMTPREFKMYIHGGTESCLLKGTPLKASDFYDPSKASVKVPTEVDWTTKGVVTPVKNQGQCGSCWAFSTTGSVESRNAIKTGKLTSLSEQELVDCSKSYGNNGCKGGLMDYGFKYVKDHGGLCSEEEYGYKAKDGTCRSSSCTTRYDAITGYVDVQRESEGSLEAAVAAGPVSIAIEADQRQFQLYHSGVLQVACGTKLDHGVLAVGYGTEGGVEYWKVKNSWGASWGEEGYIKMCRNCDANRGQGECGILDQPSYPTV